ncbi:hypothetical protein NA57DRAFT_33345 [Rhizodiscina lignyota]|uniref:Acyltransferase MbtK/IucB-like conserved domain-containing protein n=1 Tax=Rhizodiscina lignyota TaxID=1504668 RepID=A0A9P4INA3_9PEZI|nr:hypothetical protein NA57DRAFT_33345 [Rhizodiscina lignyota]
MSSPSPSEDPRPNVIAKLALPHPYLTEYFIVPEETLPRDRKLLQVLPAQSKQNLENASSLTLHDGSISFTAPKDESPDHAPPISDNTLWARNQRASLSTFEWTSDLPPSLGQAWLVVYAIFTMRPDLEVFRCQLSGSRSEELEEGLKASLLALEHPFCQKQESPPSVEPIVVISRSAFWQGAASPFGRRSPWTPSSPTTSISPPSDRIVRSKFPLAIAHRLHPRRPPKPAPGAVVYSRYIPSLDEHFSLIAVDYQNEEHLRLFHKWQNDPRVSRGWNQAGTLEEHREHLREQHEDPHTLSVLGRFNDTCFSYFEIYYCKEDLVGAYYDAGDWDRGRLSLVGNASFRGKHRVTAWWPCIIHFCFLDDHRTGAVIGEPIATNNTVLGYDYIHGLNVEKYMDLPHKRAALMKVSRERFFQLSPFGHHGGFIAGTGVPLPSKF